LVTLLKFWYFCSYCFKLITFVFLIFLF
jgi:hypothetical protein